MSSRSCARCVRLLLPFPTMWLIRGAVFKPRTGPGSLLPWVGAEVAGARGRFPHVAEAQFSHLSSPASVPGFLFYVRRAGAEFIVSCSFKSTLLASYERVRPPPTRFCLARLFVVLARTGIRETVGACFAKDGVAAKRSQFRICFRFFRSAQLRSHLCGRFVRSLARSLRARGSG